MVGIIFHILPKVLLSLKEGQGPSLECLDLLAQMIEEKSPGLNKSSKSTRGQAPDNLSGLE